jgi:alkylation response protein AidB-like acyl-CoA dehydrogenase
MPVPHITAPEDPALKQLCARLVELSGDLDKSGKWPAEQLRLCGEFGVFEWFLDPAWGGQAWTDEQVVRGYLELSAACLTTTFILTQRTGACRRIEGCLNESLKSRTLPQLAHGDTFATVGISHLTTSRRHLQNPILTAEPTSTGYRLDGYSPWVTGGQAADLIVVGATVTKDTSPNGEQILVALPTGLSGVTVLPPANLVGLDASHTGSVQLQAVEVANEQLIAGPVENVMASGLGARTGGHETSTLAVGLARAAIDYLDSEATRREDLKIPLEALRTEHDLITKNLLALACGQEVCTKESLRQRANSLVLRASQAALTAAKGTGFVVGHPAGRWCREALFFLVWSCPQPVASANLCELAGIDYVR